jgi:hypothetical protein
VHISRFRAGTRPEKIRIQKWCVAAAVPLDAVVAGSTFGSDRLSLPSLTVRYNVFKDHITLEDYEIHDGMGLELYCASSLQCSNTRWLSMVVTTISPGRQLRTPGGAANNRLAMIR